MHGEVIHGNERPVDKSNGTRDHRHGVGGVGELRPEAVQAVKGRLPALIAANVIGLALIGVEWMSSNVAPYCTGEQPAIQRGVDAAAMYAGLDLDPPPWPDGIHPGLLAHTGRALLHAGRTAEARDLADGLWAHGEDGWFAYTFDWPATDQVAPWYSAMDQGEAVGLFARLGMLDRAAETYATLQPGSTLVSDDGWLLEYPGFPPVLNGAIFAVFGLYDYWQATGDADVKAHLEDVVSVIARDVHRFRNPGELSTYERDGSRPYADYHELHVTQLRLLAEMSGMACLERAADDFDDDA